jgi:hypothetical protein
MKRIGVLLLLVVLLAACSQQANLGDNTELLAQAGSWQKMGGALDFTVAKKAINPQLLFDRSGNLVTAWIEDNNGWKLYLERWTSTGWQTFGVGFPISQSAIVPLFKVAFDKTNQPVVVTYGEIGLVVYRRESAGVWKPLGEHFFGASDIVSDKNGDIYRVASDQGTQEQLIQPWNGSSWQTVYKFQRVIDGQNIGVIALLFNSKGKPVVKWRSPFDANLRSNVFLSAWNGSSWDDLPLGFTDFITLDKKDQAIGYDFNAQDRSIFAVQGDQILGTLATNSLPYLTVDNLNRPLVTANSGTRTSGNVVVKRWTGNSWVQLGGILDRVTSRDASVAPFNSPLITDSKNTLYAAWMECAGVVDPNDGCTNWNVYVSKYVP